MTGATGKPALAGILASALAFALFAPVHAQDSFGGSSAQQQRSAQPMQAQYPQQQYPQQQQQYPQQKQQYPQQPAGASNEAQDFGVAPTQQLRPSEQLGGQTPTSIPGGKVIGTRELSGLLQGGQGNLLLLHAYGSMEHLPGAVAVVPAAQGGSFDDEVQQGFGQYLQQATGGDKSKMLVAYCGGPQCWGSYNAALRAIRLGYRNVHWYRGGIEAWRQAGLPIQGQGPQSPAQGQ